MENVIRCVFKLTVASGFVPEGPICVGFHPYRPRDVFRRVAIWEGLGRRPTRVGDELFVNVPFAIAFPVSVCRTVVTWFSFRRRCCLTRGFVSCSFLVDVVSLSRREAAVRKPFDGLFGSASALSDVAPLGAISLDFFGG